MPASETQSLESALAALQEVAPDAPFLALGQTVFWDEPMKAGVALASRRLGYDRPLVAGVHDTDYFAKLPSGRRRPGKFQALPHNDSTTKGLWSAAGEFSTLFGSETVVGRETLLAAGLRLELLKAARPSILDEATEAWGWRGIVSLDEAPPITAELPLRGIFPELMATFDWALDSSLDCLAGSSREYAERMAEEIRAEVCAAGEDHSLTVGEFYRRLLPAFYAFCANAQVPLENTRTTELLRFNRATAHLPRFEIVDAFIRPETRDAAKVAYDDAIRDGSGLYELARFGTGAIPFELVIPGVGRGVLRIGNRGIVIGTPTPQFLSLERPLEGVAELAERVEERFGPNCTLVGKAVTLIGMLAREYVFVFHEGASGYVRHSRDLHRRLASGGIAMQFNPILRVRYEAWDALQVCCSWLRLPEPFQRAFGTEELCAPSFATRWRQVAEEQEGLLRRLGDLRRPIDLIRFLDREMGGSWRLLAEEYLGLHDRLELLRRDIEEVRRERRALYGELRAARRRRVEAERSKGEQFRARIFEREAALEDLRERERLAREVDARVHDVAETENRIRTLRRRQDELARDEDVRRIHERRRRIELEAELKRLRLIRHAVIASRGLRSADHRPSAWWFRLVCPDGLWFRETVETARCYLEPLT
jgi:hypothetical protein